MPPSGRRGGGRPGPPAKSAWGDGDGSSGAAITTTNNSFFANQPSVMDQTDGDEDLPSPPMSPDLDHMTNKKMLVSNRVPPPPRAVAVVRGNAVPQTPTMATPAATPAATPYYTPAATPATAIPAATPAASATPAAPASARSQAGPADTSHVNVSVISDGNDTSMISQTAVLEGQRVEPPTVVPNPSATQYKALSMWTALQQMVVAIKLKSHRRRLKKYKATISGKELTSTVYKWLRAREEDRYKNANRKQASKICGMLYDQGLLLPAHGQVGLKDSGSHLYFVNDVGSGVGVHGLT